MNYLLYCDKNDKKVFESVFANLPQHRLLGVKVAMNDNFLAEIFEEYNPNGIIISSGFLNRSGMSEPDIVMSIKKRTPSAKIIYRYGKIENRDEYEIIKQKLLATNVFEIITESKEGELGEILPIMVNGGFTREMLDDADGSNSLSEESEENNSEPETVSIPRIRAAETPPIHLNDYSLKLTEFEPSHINIVREDSSHTKPAGRTVISVAETRGGCGGTMLSLELCAYLNAIAKNSACVVMRDDFSYTNMCDFYGVTDKARSDGINIGGVIIIPEKAAAARMDLFRFVVDDLGDAARTESSDLFSNGDLRVLVSSDAKWELKSLENYVNFWNPADTEIRFCFISGSRARFSAINRRMVKSGRSAFLLSPNSEWLRVNADNAAVYGELVKEFISRKKK